LSPQDAVSLAYSCTQSIRDGGTLVTTLDLGLLPYRGGLVSANRGMAIVNNLMRDSHPLANVPARRHRESWEAQGDWRVHALNRAATSSRIRTETPHLFDVDTENLGYAPSLSNTSARTMGRVTLEDLRDMT